MSNLKEWTSPWTSKNRDPLLSWTGRRRPFAPEQLGLRALYDYRNSTSTTMVDQSGNAVADATVGAGASSPLWLPYEVPSVYVPGVSGNYVSCPDSTALDITNDIEIVACIAPDDWTPSALGGICTKWLSAANLSFFLALDTTGILTFYMSTTGSVVQGPYSSTVAVQTAAGFTDGGFGWVKMVRTRGAGTIDFYWAAANSSDIEPAVFTRLGVQVGAATTAMFAGTGVLALGANGSGTQQLQGRVRRVIVRDGAGGTTVADFNAASCTQTGYTDTQGNVWTVNRATSGRKTVVQSPIANSARGVWLFGGDDYMTVPNAAVPVMGATDPFGVLVVVRIFPTQGDNNEFFGKHAGYSGATNPGFGLGVRVGATPTVGARLKDGATQLIFAQAPVAATRSLVGVNVSASQMTPFLNNAFGTATARVGDMTNAAAAEIGRQAGPTYTHFEFEALLTRDTPFTAAEVAQANAFYGSGL